jgi:hypothetical protein
LAGFFLGFDWGHIRFLVMAAAGSALTADYVETRKVIRRKRGTISSRYPGNGFAPQSDTKKQTTRYFMFDINFRIAYKVLHAIKQIHGGRPPCTHS